MTDALSPVCGWPKCNCSRQMRCTSAKMTDTLPPLPRSVADYIPTYDMEERVMEWGRSCALQAGVPEAQVLDVGFKYENGTHTPTALVGFAINDWDARDRFAAALRKVRDASPQNKLHSEDKPVPAALSDERIMEIASPWIATRENQFRGDGWGHPGHIRPRDIVAFARALLAAQARDCGPS